MNKYLANNLEKNISGKLLEILEYKVVELEERKKELSLDQLKKKILKIENFEIRDFEKALDKPGEISLIAEVKKASPSIGAINLDVDVVEQAKRFEDCGADAISVLTDEKFFKGHIDFLQDIKKAVNIPIFRKDFIFDEYQVYESQFYKADAILLIATILTKEKLAELISLASKLGLQCLVETHTSFDIVKALACEVEIIGINARDLESFEIDLQNIIDLAPTVPQSKILVGESGVVSADDVRILVEIGVKSILVGTTLMQTDDIKGKIKELKLI